MTAKYALSQRLLTTSPFGIGSARLGLATGAGVEYPAGFAAINAD